MGAGWSWQREQGADADHAADALEGWRQIQRVVVTGRDADPRLVEAADLVMRQA
jgi:ATP:corrinoid adenosyltransferase